MKEKKKRVMEKIYDLGTIRSNFSGLQLMINESINKTKIINGITKSKFCRHKELPLVDCLNHLLKQGALSSPCFLCNEEKRDLYAIVRSNANIGELICKFTDKTADIISSDKLKNIKKVFITVFFIRPTQKSDQPTPQKFVDYLEGLLYSAHHVKKNFPENAYKIRLYTTNTVLKLLNLVAIPGIDKLKQEAKAIEKNIPQWNFDVMKKNDLLNIVLNDPLIKNLRKFMINILLCGIIELYMYNCGDYTDKGIFGMVTRFMPYFNKDDEDLEEFHIRDLDETFGNVVDKFWIDFWKQTNINNYAVSLYDANHFTDYRKITLEKPFMPSLALSGGKPIKGLIESERKAFFENIEKLCNLDIFKDTCGYGFDEIFNSDFLYQKIMNSHISFNVQFFGSPKISIKKVSKSLELLCYISKFKIQYIYSFALYYQLYNANKIGKDDIDKFISLMNTINNGFCYEPNPIESYSYDNLKFIYETFKDDFKNIEVHRRFVLYLLYADNFPQTFTKLTNKLTKNLVKIFLTKDLSLSLDELHMGEIPEYDTNVIDLNLVKYRNIDMFLYLDFDYFLKHASTVECLKKYTIPPTIKNYFSYIYLDGVVYILLKSLVEEKANYSCIDSNNNKYIIKFSKDTHAFRNIVMTAAIKDNLSKIENVQHLIKFGQFETPMIKLSYSLNRYIKGTVLSEMGFITLDFLMSIIDQILEIIAKLKEMQLLFVDINETNIIIAPNNKIYLIDLEHVTAYGTTIKQFGKYNNMELIFVTRYLNVINLASEMILSDERLDLYCLTIVIEYILTKKIRESDKKSSLYILLDNFIKIRKTDVHKATLKDDSENTKTDWNTIIRESPHPKLDDYKDQIDVIKQRGKEVIKM